MVAAALQQRLLLTNPTYPYPTLPANDSITDATGQRFTKGDDVFTLISHTHCYANHILAQNVETPAVVLEYPRWEDFLAEVDRGYPVIGISSYPPHLDTVMRMCEAIRRRSPATKILLGSYGAMAFDAAYDEQTKRRYADHVVKGEGVRWLRGFLGEDRVDRPIRQALMPKAGGAPPYVTRYPVGTIGFLVSGLGCPGGCTFCATTSMFGRRRLQLLTADELVEHIGLYHRHFPAVNQVFVIEEDHFRQPRYLQAIKEAWQQHPEVLDDLDWFGFGSVDHIADYAARHGWEAIAALGLGTLFIGVESKFAGQHGLDKRDGACAKTVFAQLHRMGIRTVGAWMCGWDFQHHGNVEEDLNYFVALKPTYQQLTRVTPFPGTPLWDELREAGRLEQVPWEDVHFWSGSQKNVAFEPHETLNLTERGYRLLYDTWGPSILRRLEVQLAGFEFCSRSQNPVLRKHRARLHKRQCSMLWTNLASIDRFAPNGVVRRRVRKVDERYRALLGPPTPVMRALAAALDALATAFRLQAWFDPLNRHPKEEPYRRFLYDRDGDPQAATPYRAWTAPPTPGVRAAMEGSRLRTALLSQALAGVRLAAWRRGDREIDEHLLGQLRQGWLGFGF